jgi:hypothetical protein
MNTHEPPAPGDELLPEANMVFDHAVLLDATPDEIWPWLLQLGKHRAGWYLPARLERFVPRGRRALRTLDPRLQQLAVGDRIPDYGGRDEWLEVAHLLAPHTLVFTSERRGRRFTWALLLAQHPDEGTELRLRFRGHIRSHGLQRRAILSVGGFFDWATGKLMVQGLRERLGTASHRNGANAASAGQRSEARQGS